MAQWRMVSVGTDTNFLDSCSLYILAHYTRFMGWGEEGRAQVDYATRIVY